MDRKERNNPSRTLLSVLTATFALGFVFGRFLLTGALGLIVAALLIIVLGYGWIQAETIRLDKLEGSDIKY